MGRFDAELPLEVDDEYWETEDPEKAFQQPSGKPSKIAAFNSHLRLTKIVAYAMRTIVRFLTLPRISIETLPSMPSIDQSYCSVPRVRGGKRF